MEAIRMENAPLVGSGTSASLLLGRKLDSIPFSIYHVQIILVLGVVGFVEGYDLALSGSLLVLAKDPLHLTPEQVRWLAVGPILFLVVGAFSGGRDSRCLRPATVWQGNYWPARNGHGGGARAEQGVIGGEPETVKAL